MRKQGFRVFQDTGSSATTGYIIFSGISVMVFALAFKDMTFLVFGFPIVLLFALGSSFDTGSAEKNLAAVGWSSGNMKNAVPIGIIGGLAGIVLGGMLTQFVPGQMASIVPDFTGMSALLTASVVPPVLAIAANIISQWMVVAPSEEALARVLAPYAGFKIFKNWALAFLFAAMTWITMHIPTFIAQGAPRSMYVVLFILAIITSGIFLLTKTILTPIIAHGTFNTGVIIMNNGVGDLVAYFTIFIILAVLSYIWFQGDAKPLKFSLNGG